MAYDETTSMSGGKAGAATWRGGSPVLGALMRGELVLARMENMVVITAMVVAIAAVAMSVAIRTFNLPIADTGEWAMVAMSPLTFIGGALCSHLHRHLTADIVEMLPPGLLRRSLDAIAAILCLVFGLFFIVLAWDLFDYAWSSGERLIDRDTPVAIPAGFVLAGAVLMTFHSMLDIWRALEGREPGGYDPWR
ncbi:TRAP transporter small permease [Starkeya sp. 3C]|uniref:TRAP transporter small permease protein n=1 Tax=Ancylobacter moscoviensis TaxID=2597768 RepID=A0ABY3DM78_9HYPH|nr:TRAP transporter small permease subunit [Ancylobacter moscoviensis]TSJ60150.1 TRAP transporter small permease [Ancylobacter moscoviensis]